MEQLAQLATEDMLDNYIDNKCALSPVVGLNPH